MMIRSIINMFSSSSIHDLKPELISDSKSDSLISSESLREEYLISTLKLRRYIPTSTMNADTLFRLLREFRLFRYFYRGRAETDSLHASIEISGDVDHQKLSMIIDDVKAMFHEDSKLYLRTVQLSDMILRIEICPGVLKDFSEEMILEALNFERVLSGYLGNICSFMYVKQRSLDEYGFDPFVEYSAIKDRIDESIDSEIFINVRSKNKNKVRSGISLSDIKKFEIFRYFRSIRGCGEKLIAFVELTENGISQFENFENEISRWSAPYMNIRVYHWKVNGNIKTIVLDIYVLNGGNFTKEMIHTAFRLEKIICDKLAVLGTYKYQKPHGLDDYGFDPFV